MRVIAADIACSVALVNVGGEVALALSPGLLPDDVMDRLDRLLVLVPSPDVMTVAADSIAS